MDPKIARDLRTETALEARMIVQSIGNECWGDREGRGAQTLKLEPVRGAENEPWSKHTPSGRLELTITNPAAFDKLKLGKRYRVIIAEVVD